MGYNDIIGGSWFNSTLYPESIPHLLHWDLAYLWILEKQRDQRPNSWENRVQAWKLLVSHLMLGRLKAKPERLKEPLAKYAQPHGIDAVVWLTLPDSDRRVGVLSPTVLARPLPDFEETHLDRLRGELKPPGDADQADLNHFLKLAADRLQKNLPYGPRIADILEREFKPEAAAHPPQGKFLNLQILSDVSWAPRRKVPLTEVKILIYSGLGEKIFVPLCASCGRSLTQDAGAEPATVRASSFNLLCGRCKTANRLELEDFFIWLDAAGRRAVLWDKGSVFFQSPPEKGVPPRSEIRGDVVVFEFNPARLVGAPDEQRFLRLRFPETRLSKKSVREIFFDRLLLLGVRTDSRTPDPLPLPVRSHELDALAAPETIRLDQATAQLTYRDIKIHGLPQPILHALGGADLETEPDLGLGIYPDPALMPAEWKWWRVFLHGANRRKYEVSGSVDIGAKSRRILPWLEDHCQKLPGSVTVQSKDDAGCGVTYFAKSSTRAEGGVSATVHMGLDFGTTHSVIRYQLPHENEDRPFDPRRLTKIVRWLASASPPHLTAMGDSLPSESFGNLEDPCLLPSALWRLNGKSLIRWSNEPPLPNTPPATGFKWDRVPGENQELRKRYLLDLALTALPEIIDRYRLQKLPNIKLGVAYPLAFDHAARQNCQTLWNQLRSEIQTLTGVRIEFQMISESHASLNACKGRPDPRQIYLVADMGGGTVDLALFPGAGEPLHQVGSVRFGGETYFALLANRRRLTDEAREEFLWDVRDAVFSGTCCDRYGNDQTTKNLLSGFMICALEFLRTMVAAYRRQHPEQEVEILLVGNGWKLVDAFNSESRTRGSQSIFREFYDDLFKSLQDAGLALHSDEGDNVLKNLKTNKHIVAHGALLESKKSAEEMKEPQTCMPAGRTVKFVFSDGSEEVVEWHRVIGAGRRLFDRHESEIGRASIEVDFTALPAAVPNWERRLVRAFQKKASKELPYPPLQRMARWLEDNMETTPFPTMKKGPLQLLLENYWVDELA